MASDVADPIRVLIADDHEKFRRGLRMVLEAEDGMRVVAEAGNGAEAVARVAELAPDVVLMDVRMPHQNGIEATRTIRATFPSTRIIMLTVSDDEDDLFEAVKAGANGYLLKEVSIEEVADAVRAVVQGQSLITPSMATKLISEFSSLAKRVEAAGAAPSQRLSQPELDVLRRVAAGLTNEEIADQLGMPVAAVKDHVGNILVKLQLRSRLEAAALAIETGLDG